ncbi:MAG TPA: CBS domain-containing protein [Burkholderiales bacterium]|jgi:magnesium transporter|nr:CBS domain-containing protein [Burkholderiales bacterium]
MAEVNGLSVAFVEGHPAEAARVLEGLSVPDSAEFLAALAPRAAVPVLRHLRPALCTKLFEHFDDDQVGRFLKVMGAQEVAQLIQRVSAERQTRLVSRLPVGVAVAVRMLIGYPKGTCGAIMDPSPLVISPESTVAEGLEQVRQFEGEPGDCVFVCDSQRRLSGVVGLGQLVRAAPRSAVADVMWMPEHTVPALASVASIARHEGWESFRVLPVVERENRLVGAVHRQILRRQLAGGMAPADPPLATGAAGAYWQTLSALTEGVVRALPPVPPVGRMRRNDEH